MSYIYPLTIFCSDAKSYEESERLQTIFKIVEQMIYDLVPQIVEKYMKDHKEAYDIDIRTLINGCLVNSEELKKEIVSQITGKLST